MIRSYLFVPANRPDRCTKAVASEADAVIVDLEDAIPGDQKDAARAALINWLSPAHSVFIRINGTQTKWFQDDLSACRHPGVRGVVLPKADEVTDIETTASQLNSGQTVLPMVESALAFSNISHLASAKSVSRLLFGSLDLQIDLGMNAEEDELLYFRSQLVIASRIAGIEPPVDGISPTFTDRDRIELDARRARRLGFSGKLCIHPEQAKITNQVFLPTEEEERWARRVIAASAESAGAATAIDGVMIDRPVLVKAENIISLLSDRRGKTD